MSGGKSNGREEQSTRRKGTARNRSGPNTFYSAQLHNEHRILAITTHIMDAIKYSACMFHAGRRKGRNLYVDESLVFVWL